MTFKSTLTTALVFFSALAFATGPTISPVVSPVSICQGDTVSVAILTSDTFVTGNVFYVQLSDSSGNFALGTIIDTIVSQGNDTIAFAFPAVGKNSSYYQIRVVASNSTIGLDSTKLTIHNIPAVTYQVPQPSYCSYAYTVPLAGGSPAGGVYSGSYISNNAFDAYLSGNGTFKVYYTYTDTVGSGCFAEDSSSIVIASCPAPSVAVTVNPAAICPGTDININIQTSGALGSDNVFTIQLSDSTGSFANPSVLATDTSSTGGVVTIPAPVEPAGNNYQIRAVASDPATTGVGYNVSFKTHLAPPSVQLDTTGTLSLCTKDSFNLSVDSIHGVLYQWSFNGVPLTVSKYKYTAKDSGLYVVAFTDTLLSGCSSGADSVFIGVYPYPAKPTITPDVTTNICGSGTVTLSTTANNSVSFKWANHGQVISGATQVSYTATATGVYLVEAVNNNGGCITKSDSVHVNIDADPVVSFTLPFDSFCVHSAPITLTGGTPSGSGGFYSGNYVYDNATFNPDSSGIGSFKVYYTYINSIGCTGKDSTTLNVYNCTTLPSAINNVNAAHPFEIFPNPALGLVNISMPESTGCKMSVFNLLGQEVKILTFSQQVSVNIQELPAGVYLVEVSGINDSWKTTRRLVIQ